jgi:undecaprenyl-diphosphatase
VADGGLGGRRERAGRPVTVLLKEAFGRVRPAFENGGATYDSLSFPSGHSSGIATLVTIALVLAWPRLRRRSAGSPSPPGLALVVLVGLTRMWLGVHFLSDVSAAGRWAWPGRCWWRWPSTRCPGAAGRCRPRSEP